jgi:hypothetical protein
MSTTNPYSSAELCLPPAGRGISSNYSNFFPQVLFLNVTGDEIATPSPQMLISPQASGTFIFNYPLAGVFLFSLTTSIINPNAAPVAVYLVAGNLNEQFNVAGSVGILISHITLQNSASTYLGPSNRTTIVPLGSEDAMPFNAGQAMSLYVSSPDDPTVEIVASATILYRQMQQIVTN